MTFKEWIKAIKGIPKDRRYPYVGPVVGVARSLDEASRMHAAFVALHPGLWTWQTWHVGTIAVRPCRPMRRGAVAAARKALFRVYLTT